MKNTMIRSDPMTNSGSETTVSELVGDRVISRSSRPGRRCDAEREGERNHEAASRLSRG